MDKLAGLSLIALVSLVGVASQPALAQATAGKKASSNTNNRSDSLVERGKYIVERVAMCERCHTPRDGSGNPERTKWLQGGPVQNQVTYPVANYAQSEPRIAGAPPGTDEQFITLMMTGISRTGAPPNPPMPPFRMTREDAQAVLAYLKSLR